MTFVLPWVFALGVATAAGVVALHLLSTQRPPVRPLPTARFVPESDVRAVSRTSRPTDLLLLALRVLAVLLIAAAFAQPIPDAPGPAVRRVVALEWTTALVDADAARTRAAALLGDGDALVVFDTAARVLPAASLEGLALPTVRAAALSPMLVAVRDAAATIARGADSLAVTVLSAFPSEAWDAATPALRATWPGRVELVQLAAAVDTLVAPPTQLASIGTDDPVAAGVASLDDASAAPGALRQRGAHAVRVQRGPVGSEDSLWLQRTAGGVLLAWPDDTTRPVRADGVLGTLGEEAALVAPLARLDLTMSATGSADRAANRIIARWRDGEPAAAERALGQGCLREVGIGVPARGDLTLRAPFLQLLRVLVEPCGGQRSPSPEDSVLAAFAGSGTLAAATAFAGSQATSALTPWLLLLALVLLLFEQWWRRRDQADDAR
ncbi:BatA domain-containing protein [Pseudogemmatithrix spongiicola]|uniref:BatA domain-containing protein n=1 Tax=Pseudogemmatithrix spongiicola TaxID=3062599 RepID=A0AA49JTS7_9BACT|nr:BatA domain-containing protein [Gemmatimonadaceae bacterium 'strain 138']WKW14418.1 BatA domain-containing protein [Gemmatimonadaceae bacterium 'strain 318']